MNQLTRELKINDSMLHRVKNFKNNEVGFTMIDFSIDENIQAGFLFHRSDETETAIILARVFNDSEVQDNKCYAYSFDNKDLDSFFTKDYEFLTNKNKVCKVSFIN